MELELQVLICSSLRQDMLRNLLESVCMVLMMRGTSTSPFNGETVQRDNPSCNHVLITLTGNQIVDRPDLF